MIALTIIFILVIIGLCFYGAYLYKSVAKRNGRNLLAQEEKA